MPRISLKIVGASGQGINSIGAIIAKGLKRSGYCVFGYREYPSLIKGGHASDQVDVSNERICSTETKVNVLVALNHHGLESNMEELKQGGIVLHVTPGWQFPEHHQKLIAERNLRVIYFPVDDILNRLGARAVLSNVLLTAFVWSMLDQDIDALKSLVGETFAKKKALLELNMRCIDEGYSFVDPEQGTVSVALQPPDKGFASHLLITGSQAMGLGAVHAGVRLYAGYPMTPSSPLLSFIAELENKTHMVVKQAEDEITAAQIVSGAMYMGTRALTATSGVGFDLMSETLSLNAMIENPTVFVLAQRPGPATGLPTWTAQGGLLQAANCSAGEFTRCVISVSNSQDAFDLMPVAFNLAEQYQISVIVLTDKQIAEALYTQQPYDLERADITRGRLVVDPEKLKLLKSSDRFNPHAVGGVSLRWLPAPHLSIGGRSAKMTDWMDVDDEIELLAIGWGSTGDVFQDVMCSDELRGRKIAYLHYTYLWPLRTQELRRLAMRSKRIVLVEQNYQGQLGMLIRMECGLDIWDKILKYDGRPFFYDELLSSVMERCASTSENEGNVSGFENTGTPT